LESIRLLFYRQPHEQLAITIPPVTHVRAITPALPSETAVSPSPLAASTSLARMRRSRLAGSAGRAALAVWLLAPSAALPAQGRIASMPGHAQYLKLRGEIPASVRSGGVTAEWSDDSRSFSYLHEGKRWRFDLATKRAVEAPPQPVRRKPVDWAAPAWSGDVRPRWRSPPTAHGARSTAIATST
jgi:hypothetical protein